MKRRVTTVDQIVGNRIRARRLELHVSQVQLAELLGVSFQQVQKYEKAANRVSAGRLSQIAHHLKTDVGYFVGDLDGRRKPAKVTPLAAFLATKDGVAINEAMLVLDQSQRKAVISLAKTLAKPSRRILK
jgi:transcriptional regulator with XRE-family HTH domain